MQNVFEKRNLVFVNRTYSKEFLYEAIYPKRLMFKIIKICWKVYKQNLKRCTKDFH